MASVGFNRAGLDWATTFLGKRCGPGPNDDKTAAATQDCTPNNEDTFQTEMANIGGIAQKLPAAQRDGAKLFLVAAANCAEAVRAHYDPGKMRLVKVEKLADAIKDVEAWRDNPKADLPRCTR